MFKDESYKISCFGLKIGSQAILRILINIIAAGQALFRLLINSCQTLLGLIINIITTSQVRFRLLINSCQILLVLLIDIIAASWARFKLLMNSCQTLLRLLINIFATGLACFQLLIKKLVTKKINVLQAMWICYDSFLNSLCIDSYLVDLIWSAKVTFICCILPTLFFILNTTFVLYPSQYIRM